MKYLRFHLLLALLSCLPQLLYAQKVFTHIDSLWEYATQKNMALQMGNIRIAQAKKAKIASILAIPDVTGNLSMSYTNNVQLPVNLFPAEAFGGEKGTFREIQSGVQYQTNQNLYADVKLLNLQAWQGLKLAKVNIESNETDNKVQLKTLYENIAVLYYNILTLQAQQTATEQNLTIADSLLQSAQRKYKSGLVRVQDVTDTRATYLSTTENVKQIQFLLSQQYNALKVLCDIPEKDSIAIQATISEETLPTAPPSVVFNGLGVTQNRLKEDMARISYKQSRLAYLPTASFFVSQTNQQFNTRARLFDSEARWIPSSFIGLKLNIAIPHSNTISQNYKAKYEYQLAQKRTEQAQIQAELASQKLGIDYEKAFSQWKTNQEIYALRKDTYDKNFLNYQEGIISLDQTLNSFQAMVNSRYQSIASSVDILLTKTKIDIHNKIK